MVSEDGFGREVGEGGREVIESPRNLNRKNIRGIRRMAITNQVTTFP
jgi:hypothetical protein